MSNKVPQEVIDRYISGEATLLEIAEISEARTTDPALNDLIEILEKLHSNGSLSIDEDIPMASVAAMSDNNLCDVLCEQYILREYIGDEVQDSLEEEMLNNRWLNASGTPLHNIGRLMEQYGLSVVRKYDCTLEEMRSSLAARQKLIAVVDYGHLTNVEANGIYHAVVVLNINGESVRIFDPAINCNTTHLLSDFIEAWSFSRHYMVSASVEEIEYHPHPINVCDVELDEQLLELTESIAENAHEIWARKRYDEGWRYGPKRDDDKLQTPDMVPYSELPEMEKYYDRDLALNTIRLVKKLGYNISRRYTKYCPSCGELVSDTMVYCPVCGRMLPCETE